MQNHLKARGATCLGSFLAALTLTFVFLHTCAVAQTPTLLGDLDADTKPTVLDLQRLLNHINSSQLSTPPLSTQLLPYADVRRGKRPFAPPSASLPRRLQSSRTAQAASSTFAGRCTSSTALPASLPVVKITNTFKATSAPGWFRPKGTTNSLGSPGPCVAITTASSAL